MHLYVYLFVTFYSLKLIIDRHGLLVKVRAFVWNMWMADLISEMYAIAFVQSRLLVKLEPLPNLGRMLCNQASGRRFWTEMDDVEFVTRHRTRTDEQTFRAFTNIFYNFSEQNTFTEHKSFIEIYHNWRYVYALYINFSNGIFWAFLLCCIW